MQPSIQSFTRNASCPSQGALTLRSNSLHNQKYSSSVNNFPNYRDEIDHSHRESVSSIEENKTNLLQRIKTRVVKFFQHLSNDPSPQSPPIINLDESVFSYDPDVDLREDHLTLLSKRLLTTLRDSQIKHLTCDHVFLPCHHLRNIARQCLIMSAEEPFGIMGAQIKIKLTLSSAITKYLPVIRVNPKQKIIFEIEIDLHEDTKALTLRRLLPNMKIFANLREKSPLYISPRCLLVKQVFYKTAEPKRAFIDI